VEQVLESRRTADRSLDEKRLGRKQEARLLPPSSSSLLETALRSIVTGLLLLGSGREDVLNEVLEYE
jgi:hypothetical protein